MPIKTKANQSISAPVQWSQYQIDIFDAVKNTQDNISISAVAGSGKTTVLVEIVKHLPKNSNVLFLAFNKHIAETLQKKVGNGATCKTLHALGFKMLAGQRKIKMDNKKTLNIVKSFLNKFHVGTIGKYNMFSFTPKVCKILDLCKFTKTNVKSEPELRKTIDHFGLMTDLQTFCKETGLTWGTMFEVLSSTLAHAYQETEDIFTKTGVIDFSDMLYLPSKLGLTLDYDVVLIDEAQDLNTLQIEMVTRIGTGGRVISVGDENQAIMGFSGSLNDSLPQIVANTNATVYPLSVCYRCPTSHIREARELVPRLESPEWAKEGMVNNISLETMVDNVTPEDMIICRMNAPLVPVALKLLSEGRQARIRGREFHKGLVKTIKKIDKNKEFQGSFEPAFTKKLEVYQGAQISIISQLEDREEKLARLNDELGCILAVMQIEVVECVEDLVNTLESIFADETQGIVLSSIHRCKGLECRDSYILAPDKMALQFKGQQPWQTQQEANVKYVGLTRAKRGLFYVN